MRSVIGAVMVGLCVGLSAAADTAFVPPAVRGNILRTPPTRLDAKTTLTPAECGITAPNGLEVAPGYPLIGSSAPLGFFDPLGFTKNKSTQEIARLRECELKHGRLAMFAVLGWMTQTVFHPLYGGKLSADPLKAITEVPAPGIIQLLFFIGFFEYVTMNLVKKYQRETPGRMDLPGDYLGTYGWYQDIVSTRRADGIDDFPVTDSGVTPEQWVGYQTRELNNGRLAMMAIVGLIVQDVLFGQYGDILFTRLAPQLKVVSPY